MQIIKSKAVKDFVWELNTNLLMPKDEHFIARLQPQVYHNDLSGKLWTFDRKLPSGRWLENITFSRDLHSAHAIVLTEEAANKQPRLLGEESR